LLLEPIGNRLTVAPMPAHHTVPERRPDMMDVLYLALILGFLALSWGLVELCSRLERGW
jgi:hypothetical protein